MKKILSAITAATVLMGTTAAYAAVNFPIPETKPTTSGPGIAPASNPWQGDPGEYSNCLQIDADSGLVRLINKYNEDDYLKTRKEITIVIIPESMDGIPVKGVDESAFRGCTNLVAIKFPTTEDFKYINEHAFEGCVNLQSVAFPNHLEKIGESAFRYCSSLDVVTIPKSVTEIGSHAFNTCNNLEAINMDYNDYYFSNDGILFDVKAEMLMQYPAGKKDKDYTARNQVPTGISSGSVVNTARILNIDGGAFEANEHLETVTINAGYKSLGAAAFFDCTGLKNVTILLGSGDNVITAIQDDTFSGCTSLETIALPSSLKSIGTNAFYNCESLIGTDDGENGMVIPDGVTTIGAGAFILCSSLTEIHIPSSVKDIKYSYKYPNTDPTYNWYEGYLWHEEYEDFYWLEFEPYSKYEGYEGFFLAGCTGMLEIKVDEGNKKYYDHNGVLYEKINPGTINEEHYLIHYPLGRPVDYKGNNQNYTYTVPNGVVGVRSTAFSQNQHLRVVVLPQTITRIEDYAFSDSVLKDVKINGKIKTVNSTLFKRCTELESVTFDKDCGLETIGDNAFDGCESLNHIGLPEGLKTIGSSAFNDCTSLKTIDLPASVTTIKDHAFSNSGLTRFNIYENITTINESVFEGCADLEKITIPANVTEIRANAFKDSGLKEITIPANVTEIGANAFENSALKELKILSADTELSEGAFANCDALKKVHIPKGVETIKESVFSNDENITDVYFGGTEEEWKAIDIQPDNGSLNTLEGDRIHYNSSSGNSGNTGSGDGNGGGDGDDDGKGDDDKNSKKITVTIPNNVGAPPLIPTLTIDDLSVKFEKSGSAPKTITLGAERTLDLSEIEPGVYTVTFSAKYCAPREYKNVLVSADAITGLSDVELRLYGDLNGDGYVDILDAQLANKHFLNTEEITDEYELKVLDVDQNEVLLFNDAVTIYMHSQKLINIFAKFD